MTEKGVRIDYLVGRHDRAATSGDLRRASWRRRRPSSRSAPTISPRPPSASAATTPAAFLGAYIERGIFEKDPFVSIDVEGVGALVRLAAERARAARPDVKLGICGEHGGDPASIAFCESVGLDYVSCSPYRVPIARLAAAHAALNAKGGVS